MIMETAFLSNYALLFLRIIVAIVFFSSGKKHFENPVERGKSIGMAPIATKILGLVEMIAAISLSLGTFVQLGALLILLVMAGAIYKKIFEWNTGFYADKGFGWHYDLLLLLGAFLIFTTGGGRLIII